MDVVIWFQIGKELKHYKCGKILFGDKLHSPTTHFSIPQVDDKV